MAQPRRGPHLDPLLLPRCPGHRGGHHWEAGPCSALEAGPEEVQLTPPSLSGPLFPADTQGWMEDVKQFTPQLAHIVRMTPPPSREGHGEVKNPRNEVEMQHPAPGGRGAMRGGMEGQREAATHALRSPFCDSHGEGKLLQILAASLGAGTLVLSFQRL